MSNLKSWQKGTSGNPNGRPKGSRNIKSIIQDLLNDKTIYKKLSVTAPEGTQTPLEAIIYTLMIKSIGGDTRVLLRRMEEVFFSAYTTHFVNRYCVACF